MRKITEVLTSEITEIEGLPYFKFDLLKERVLLLFQLVFSLVLSKTKKIQWKLPAKWLNILKC